MTRDFVTQPEKHRTQNDVRRSLWIAAGFPANQLPMNRRIFTALLALLLSPTLFAQTPPAAPADAAAARQRVTLKELGPNKIEAIKVTREVTGLGLADAKKLVESVPTLVKDASPEEAAKIARAFAAIGAKAEITSLNGQVVTPAPAVPTPTSGEGAYRVTLESFGESKIQTIKIVREVTGLGLAETKKLVESAPVVIKETDEARAKALVKSLEAIGAKAKAELLKK